MTRCISLVLGLCLLSLIAVVLLSASPEEKLERSLSRLQSADSLNELNRVYGAGDRTPNLLIRRAELLLAKGEVDEAKRTYEALASISETELLARNAMAEAAINLGDIPAAVAQLKEAHALDPSPESLDRLARLYELTRDTDAERGILLMATPDTLSDRSARRLLDLSILEGSMGAAETLLRARAEVASPARSQMRGYLAELLVGSDRADEAATLGAEWFGRNHDSVALSLTVSRLIERGFVDPAETLARVATMSGLPGAHIVISAFANTGHGIIARELLRDWLSLNPELDDNDQAALLAYSEIMNDFTAARALLRRGPVESFSPDFVVGVMRASYYRFGTAALSEFQDYLVPSILDADPIFAAEVMLGQQRPTDASRYLENAATLGMQPWKHDEWVKLVERITPVAARKHLMAIRPGGNPS